MKCDCHIHIALDGVYYRDALARHRGHVDEGLIRSRLRAYADAGITYLRDGGDNCGAAAFARTAAGEYGIEYVMPAFPIHRKGRYGDFIGRAYETEADYLRLLDEAEAAGADFIKLMAAGIMDFSVLGRLSCEPLDGDELAALIRLAHARGFAVMVHVNGDRAVRDAVAAGADSIEHANFTSEETRRMLADSGTVWVPTLAPIANIIDSGRFPRDVLRRIAEIQMASVADAAARGAYIALGSDGGAWGVPHPGGANDELRHLRCALGEGAELVLGLGSARIREVFRRR